MKTIIVDDEIKAIDLLEYHLTEFFDDFSIIGKYTNINDAMKNILKNKPDVIFLDINMPNGSGLSLLEQIADKNIPVIFVTAHSEYALNAIKLNAFDYLLKPLNINELNRVHKKLLSRQSIPVQEFDNNKISIKISSTIYVFNANDIINVISDGNYCTVYSSTKKPIVLSRNLKKVEEEYFSSHPFLRCHQSHIINVNHIDEYTNIESTLSNGKRIPFSKKKYLEFISTMQ